MLPCGWKVLEKVSELVCDAVRGKKRGGKKVAGLGSGMVIALVHVFGRTLGRRAHIRFSIHPFFFCLS